MVAEGSVGSSGSSVICFTIALLESAVFLTWCGIPRVTSVFGFRF